MSIKVEPHTPKDYNNAINIIKRSITISQGKIYPRELTENFCIKYDFDNFVNKAKDIEYFVAKDENTVTGIIGLKNNELRTFFVDPDFQGKGIGRQLYNYLENKAKERGIQKLILEGSPLGEPIYLKFGFIKLKTIDKEKAGVKYTDAYMEKELI
jgi:GNAT superfamily N-acetyltransferase